MKTLYKIFKNAFKLFIVLITIISIVSAPIFFKGYKMYKDSINMTSLEEKINKIESKNSYISIDDLSEEFIETLLISEDDVFYEHSGVNFLSIFRAAVNNIKKQRLAEGGSTITQQLAKNLYFSFNKTFERKIAEILVAKDLEKKYEKDKILELYCNVVYFGEGQYGIKEAANHYYNKKPKDLNLKEIKSLVYTLKSPVYNNPNAIKKN